MEEYQQDPELSGKQGAAVVSAVQNMLGNLKTLLTTSGINAEPIPPSARQRGIPDWLDQVVLRFLNKDPAKRFQSTDDFHSALKDAAGLELASSEIIAKIASESRNRNSSIEALSSETTQTFSIGQQLDDTVSSMAKPETSSLEILEPGPRLEWIDFEGVPRYRLLLIQSMSRVRIGRAPNNDIVLEAEGVSRYPAVIDSSQIGTLQVTDLNSGNGTFVNESRIFSPHTLSPGDRIQIGAVILGVAA